MASNLPPTSGDFGSAEALCLGQGVFWGIASTNNMSFRWGLSTAEAAMNVDFGQVVGCMDGQGWRPPKQALRLRFDASEPLSCSILGGSRVCGMKLFSTFHASVIQYD